MGSRRAKADAPSHVTNRPSAHKSHEVPWATQRWCGMFSAVVVTARDDIRAGMEPATGPTAVEWRISEALTPYDRALEVMDSRVAEIAAGTAPELVWLVEHPPLFTAG